MGGRWGRVFAAIGGIEGVDFQLRAAPKALL